jgi:hypothetical protein
MIMPQTLRPSIASLFSMLFALGACASPAEPSSVSESQLKTSAPHVACNGSYAEYHTDVRSFYATLKAHTALTLRGNTNDVSVTDTDATVRSAPTNWDWLWTKDAVVANETGSEHTFHIEVAPRGSYYVRCYAALETPMTAPTGIADGELCKMGTPCYVRGDRGQDRSCHSFGSNLGPGSEFGFCN